MAGSQRLLGAVIHCGRARARTGRAGLPNGKLTRSQRLLNSIIRIEVLDVFDQVDQTLFADLPLVGRHDRCVARSHARRGVENGFAEEGVVRGDMRNHPRAATGSRRPGPGWGRARWLRPSGRSCSPGWRTGVPRSAPAMRRWCCPKPISDNRRGSWRRFLQSWRSGRCRSIAYKTNDRCLPRWLQTTPWSSGRGSLPASPERRGWRSCETRPCEIMVNCTWRLMGICSESISCCPPGCSAFHIHCLPTM